MFAAFQPEGHGVTKMQPAESKAIPSPLRELGGILIPLNGGAFSGGNQLVFAQSVDVGNNLGSSECEQTCNSKPKPEMRPPAGICDGIPPWPPRHDFLPLLAADRER
jgi:hypothetical protein